MIAPSSVLPKRGLSAYASRATLRAVATLTLATVSAFIALRLVPGDALTLLAAGRHLDPAIISAWSLRYGLDQAPWIQYLLFVRNLLEGDFGLSYYYSGQSVAELLAPALRTTVLWQFPALLLCVVGALALAIATSGTRRNWLDSVVTWVLLGGFSAPEFVVATVLVSVFALRLRLLPVAGVTTPMHFILPAVTMAIPVGAALCQMLRNELMDVLNRDYVRTARSKGLSESRILIVHALPNAAPPFLVMVAYQVGRCIGGAFLIETIFNIPGVGRLTVLGVMHRDYPVVLASVTVMTLAFVITSLLTDIVAAAIDPRMHSRAKAEVTK